MKQKHWPLLLAAVLLLSFFLRFFNLQELFYFTHDEETIVWRIMPLLRDRNLFLLGGVTPFHVHLGPWFYYLSAAILYVSNLNPLGWGTAAAILGAITTLALFKLSKQLFNFQIGLIASLLYATSFLMIAFDRHWWPLVLNPFISVSVIYCLYQITIKKFKFFIPLSLLLALGFHTDPSTWALLILTFVVFIKYKLPLKQKYTLLALVIFALSFLPLIAFDIKNSGTNLKGVNQYLSETKPQQGLSLDRFTWTLLFIPRTLGRLIYTSDTDLSHNYAYCSQFSSNRLQNSPILLTLFATLIIAYFFINRQHQKQTWIIKAYLIIIILGINLYGNFFSSDLFDHYLSSLFPLFFIMLARVFSKKTLVFTFITLIIFLNLYSFKNITNTHNLKDKTSAIDWVNNQLQGEPFILDSLGTCFGYNGTRYLFELSGNPPSQSFVDQNFAWLYQSPSQTQPPQFTVTILDPNDLNSKAQTHTYQQLLQQIPKIAQFGHLQVLITPYSPNPIRVK